MNDLKMGFKHTLLERLHGLEMALPHKSNNNPKNTETINNTQVTDFSIQRILGEVKDKTSHASTPNILRTTKTATSVATTILSTSLPSIPQLVQPVPKKPLVCPDILDLSKNKSAHSQPQPIVTSHPPALEVPYFNSTNCGMLNPSFLAAVAAANAQKFYAQFIPHMFNAAGAYTNNVTNNFNRLPQHNSYPRRYFAPYILSPPINTVTSTQLQQRLTSSSTSLPSSEHTSHRPTSSKFVCARNDCLDCLHSFYKHSSVTTSYPFNSSLIFPAVTTTSASTTNTFREKSKSSADLILKSPSNLSLTAVTNIQVTASRKASASSVFDSPSTLTSNTEEISYKCRICEKVFGCSQTLQAHEKTHKSPRYECSDCGKGFSQLRNYKYHLSVHRGTKEFAAECPECGKTFNDKGYLSSHMKIHRNKKEYECPYCPKSFNQRVAFNMHVRIHTGVKPHKCAECGKRFSRKMLLKQHMRTHSGEKPYQCSVCGKSFADRSNMTLHHRLHSGIKPFNCPICPKAFTKKHHLKTHLNYHTGCKPYVCPHPNCNQAFTQSSNMRTHAKKCQYKPLQLPYPAATNATVPTINSTANALMSNTLSSLAIHNNNGLAVNAQTSAAAAAAASLQSSSSIPIIPSTNLSAGIRILNSAASAAAVVVTPTIGGQSAAFPPAQQPLLSTLRPF
uniref:C2H2-type domain-containing protein n=1 Tax=Glossina brevipalpis TaxID=37001 RepID=A0A1A9X297_9MUSC